MASNIEAEPSAEDRLSDGTPGPSDVPSTRPRAASRRWLTSQAACWRLLGQIGVYFNRWPNPKPPEPTFVRDFSTTGLDLAEAAILELAFYLPPDYTEQIGQGRMYPVVVNFHGGGFIMGTAKDNARWAATVLERTNAVFVSVGYRLAPEFPFPTAVEDGVEAILHLAAEAEAYGIDAKQMALSGFSAGGNLAFTTALRLQAHLQSIKNNIALTSPDGRPEPNLPEIVSIVAWYPSLDQRLSREERRATCSRPEKTLPNFLTSLFDLSYLPDAGTHSSPFASPSAASDEALASALPGSIAIFLCEWDMMMQEGRDFAERLRGLDKTVHTTLIKETRHGFDQSPYLFGVHPKVTLHYGEACDILRDVFDPKIR